MKNFGGLLLMVGVGQAIFQAYVWLSSGYWSNFTAGDLLAELGIGFGHLALGRGALVLDWVLSAELSLSLICIGFVTTLLEPLRRAYDQIHALRVIRATQRDLEARRTVADPLATQQ